MIKSSLLAGLAVAMLSVPALADGDPAKGERIFNKCKSCHAIGEGAKNKVGPVLTGVVGAPAGQNPDFKYSDALLAKAGEGLVWDEASLTAYLTKPKDLIPKTKMSFPGLRKEQEIADIIAYMKTFE